MTTLTCPECGVKFTPHHGRQRFCTPEHKAAFHNLMKARGCALTPLVQTWRRGRHAGAGVGRYAFGELAKLADIWNAEDKAAGRDATLTVKAKEAVSWRAADLAR